MQYRLALTLLLGYCCVFAKPCLALEEAEIEQMYAERVWFMSTYLTTEAVKHSPQALQDYQQALVRKIDALDISTVGISIKILKQMDPLLRYMWGSCLLSHYGGAAQQPLAEAFQASAEPALQYVFLDSGMAIARGQHEYNLGYLLLLARALRVQAGGNPTPLPDGKPGMSQIAMAELRRIFPTLPAEFNTDEEGYSEGKQKIFNALGDWLLANEKAIYIDEKNGTFCLDQEAKAQGKATEKNRVWPLIKPNPDWNMHQTFDFKGPQPGG